MDPIVLKVYDADFERIGDIIQHIGYLNIIQRSIEIQSKKVMFYNAIFFPINASITLKIPYIIENITTYDNLLECVSDFDKKGYYLKPEDMQKFKPIANLQFKQLLEKIVYSSEEGEEEEPKKENTIFCIKCGKDPGTGFFHLTDGVYCIECYRKVFCCKVPETLPEDPEEEVNPQSVVGTCYTCNKVFPINKMNLNPLADAWQCHSCYYELNEAWPEDMKEVIDFEIRERRRK